MQNSNPSRSEPDLLELALASATDHDPGLHPIELQAAARFAFTASQVTSILQTPALLDWLARQWLARPPTPEIIDRAQRDDPDGRAHLELLRQTGQLLGVRTRAQHTLAAGTGGGAPEILTDDHSQDAGIVVTRRIFRDLGMLDIAIESETTVEGNFPVVALFSLSEDQPPIRLLFLLIPTPAGNAANSYAESRLSIDATITSDQLSVYRTPVEATRLSGSLLAAVSHSVTVAKLPWKTAWRGAALATPEGHPLRAAVLRGLNARS
jgi:hypothetical protein